MRLLVFLLPWLIVSSHAALKVVVLHPVLGEIASTVGGDGIEVTSLLRPNQSPHHFEPAVDQLKGLEGADLCLAPDARGPGTAQDLAPMLPQKTRLVKIGEFLPLLGLNQRPLPPESNQTADLHWWHSVSRVRRAVGLIERELTRLQPDQAPFFRERARLFQTRLDDLDRWIRVQVATLPAERRILATTHAAFAYFCADYGFRQVALQGVNQEQMPDATHLIKLIQSLKNQGVQIIFPESLTNPKLLDALVFDTGIKLGPVLDADGLAPDGYEAMMRKNVGAIVTGLR